ncbi:hypothetical protein AUJ30_00375 [Candidatus Wolfebacteria bacterium CG1_02_39_135]|uniref:Uncharacterized protein n=3 Tax=Candidatus Wolfeibacteriota TaxID=1752735 RepID=A0A2M7Q769_9BACT|nr:hypothetical protein [Parcubacteria group bacterium]NCO89511.1 hypothetical protein [Candidatus Wolfebacteria bacterium]OIO65842.1 MAG: hypothetical protein AUJ30_00375 [Candidatus Wolfebacteria bacterium CG1_02_39_135]PIY59039.1 MAG: hypothetical protein COY97_01025 [Candidatus Wolfebacteria bacterium CG_4_10_14_0_8_um_filter_39_64]PJB84072.1 MAG: hypothetical protein CO087_00620 [Candidatus Wolfebacteria bacterium CG_4_9_14_0_8_um_filter_39_46]
MDQFNHSIIEKDIERLSKEIAEKKNLPEYKEVPERELIKQTLQPLVRQATSDKQQVTKKEEETKETVLPDYLKDSPPEIKLRVEKLVDLVFHQGIEKTIKEANQAGPFILDAFHDALTDKLYDELKKRNLI